MSIVPAAAQINAMQNNTMTVAPIARPIGDGGVSTISRAAGRKASSSPFLTRLWRNDLMRRRVNLATAAADLTAAAALADFMDSRLQSVQ
jgi:hypothetical protein